MCHSGVGLTPTVQGKVHNFSAGGLYNGLVLLIDDETQTYWDHITGEAVHGPLKGEKMDVWGVDFTTVRVALESNPKLRISRPKGGVKGRLMAMMHKKALGKKGFLPPGFRGTMDEVDPRLPELSQGVGLFDDERARFYPMNALTTTMREDPWGERTLRVGLGSDGLPEAVFVDDGTRPMQLFTRWYGFALTFPGCEIGG